MENKKMSLREKNSAKVQHGYALPYATRQILIRVYFVRTCNSGFFGLVSGRKCPVYCNGVPGSSE